MASMDVRERANEPCLIPLYNRLIRMQFVKTLSSFTQIIEKQQRLSGFAIIIVSIVQAVQQAAVYVKRCSRRYLV
ncbi:hypothetical protein T4D_1616 [Trichinella pseudospiralis]|uniref:Uncharacterized protein n=1 Tax=Trichinella pseudospiralis TaxID=6337 RepID=A0A0V1FW95_TRIPS|nr:hypothetical protein T4D_1616 [Trichinella pseudospiralis]